MPSTFYLTKRPTHLGFSFSLFSIRSIFTQHFIPHFKYYVQQFILEIEDNSVFHNGWLVRLLLVPYYNILYISFYIL